MSDQLTLDGLGEASKTPPKAKKEKALPPKNNILDKDLQSRLEKAMEVEKKFAETTPVVAIKSKSAIVMTSAPTSQELSEIFGDLEEETKPKKSEPEVLTVTDLNRQIKGILEKTYPFIWVKGEISNFKVPASGHMYFTLKDSGAQIRSVMFKGFAQHLKFRPEDGMEVLVRARVTVYEPRGDYQLFCEVMEPVGYGALQVAFEKLKARLQKEGLFDQARKKPIPGFPQRIGIITSPTGAAIRDMLNVLGRRFGGTLDITIIPTAVQGDKAPGEIAKAVNMVSRMGRDRFDVIIVGRGGGSLEDLWAFNTEEVARAVASCSLPIISAVGHEVDFTICDFVADLRAPTPSAAAELVVRNKADLLEKIRLLGKQITHLMAKKIQIGKSQTENISKRLVDPKRRLQDLMLRCDEWSDRLLQSMERFIADTQMGIRLLMERLPNPQIKVEQLKQRLELGEHKLTTQFQTHLKSKEQAFSNMALKLNSLSPLAVLDRGYSIVKKEGSVIKDSSQLHPGDKIEVKMSQGEVQAQVL